MSRDLTDAMRERISASAKARGATGCIKPRKSYVVACAGRILYDGHIKKDAVRMARCWIGFSKSGEGWAAGKEVTHTCNGEAFTLPTNPAY